VPSSIVSISESQTGENISSFLSNDATTDCDTDSNDDLPITLSKSKCTCTSHPISCFVSYSHMFPSFRAFIFFYGLIFCSQVCVKSLVYPRMKECYKGKMLALEQNVTWDLDVLSPEKKAVRC